MDFIDPHFHYWDITPSSVSGHSSKIIKNPQTYLPKDYIADMANTGLTLKKAVFVEALSDKPLEEVNWVTTQISSNNLVKEIPHKIVAYADFSEDSGTVDRPKTIWLWVCVKFSTIIQQTLSSLGLRDYLQDPKWCENFALLGKYNFSFDFQGNPHQLLAAAALFKQHPNIPVVIDHLGTLYLRGEEDKSESLRVWREGLQAMAKLPHVHMKLSMLGFICTFKEEHYPPEIKDLVLETISLFGPSRCMFASNYPVDKDEVSPQKLYQQFQEFVVGFSDNDKKKLFVETAEKFYRV